MIQRKQEYNAISIIKKYVEVSMSKFKVSNIKAQN